MPMATMPGISWQSRLTLVPQAVVFLIALLGTASAQTYFGDAHIVPERTPPRVASDHPAIRANTDLVLVPITVLDRRERVVSGLKAGNFAVFDGKSEQTIKYFSSEDAPISLTVVLDASGSMSNKMEGAREAVRDLFGAANQQDEFNLISFGNAPRVLGRHNGSLAELDNDLAIIKPEGFTAMWDALYLGIESSREASYARRAIVLISDGGDNYSRFAEKDVRSALEEADVQLYAIGIFNHFPRTPEERAGPLRLDEIASATGGRLISVQNSGEMVEAVEEIGRELRNQYVVGYRPEKSIRDGKWRRIRVQLKQVPAESRFHLYAKKGYYAPVE